MSETKTDLINILVVDDSAFVRRIIASYFRNDNEINILAEAKDGKDGLEKIKSTKFDLVITDFEMPEMNGAEMLTALKNDPNIKDKPPVIVFSSFTSKGSQATVACLMAGARDYIQKPSNAMSGTPDDTTKESIKKKIISIVENERMRANLFKSPVAKPDAPRPTLAKRLRNPGLVVIGCSTGGPAALEKTLIPIPANFKYPILVVQHMPEHFTKIMADTLNKKIALEVIEVTEKTQIEVGKVYLAGGGSHMIMEDVNTVKPGDNTPRNFCVPSVDILFESVAAKYNKGVMSVMLTGMGSDGKDGVKALKDSLDCVSIVQDQASSVVWAMPRAVYEAGLSDEMLSIDQIGVKITNV